MLDEIEHLYKYRSLAGEDAQFVRSIIVDNQLFFSSADSFNDPYDCFPILTSVSTVKEYETYYRGVLKRKQPHLPRAKRITEAKRVAKLKARDSGWNSLMKTVENDLTEHLRATGVLSFSANPNNVLLWSHYADHHRGICLRFEGSSTTPFFGEAQQVHYEKQRPEINIVRDEINKKVVQALLTKADFWSYEEEWRMVGPIRNPGVNAYPPKLLTGIIFGARINPDDKKDVERWVNESGKEIQLLQAKMSDTEFRISAHAL